MANDSGKRQTRSDKQADTAAPPAKRQRTSAFDVGTFSLIASDGTAFPVNAVVLAGNCKVFFDMLETGESEEKSCTLSESKEDVEEFLKAFTDETWLPQSWQTPQT
ncbi:hypothetical protein NBRC10512v2_004802 [Rhodotorula toruloides]